MAAPFEFRNSSGPPHQGKMIDKPSCSSFILFVCSIINEPEIVGFGAPIHLWLNAHG